MILKIPIGRIIGLPDSIEVGMSVESRLTEGCCRAYEGQEKNASPHGTQVYTAEGRDVNVRGMPGLRYDKFLCGGP